MWNFSSLYRQLKVVVHVSAPYKRIDITHARYTRSLDPRLICLTSHTEEVNLQKPFALRQSYVWSRAHTCPWYLKTSVYLIHLCPSESGDTVMLSCPWAPVVAIASVLGTDRLSPHPVYCCCNCRAYRANCSHDAAKKAESSAYPRSCTVTVSHLLYLAKEASSTCRPRIPSIRYTQCIGSSTRDNQSSITAARKILKSVGARQQPWPRPVFKLKLFDTVPSTLTRASLPVKNSLINAISRAGTPFLSNTFHRVSRCTES